MDHIATRYNTGDGESPTLRRAIPNPGMLNKREYPTRDNFRQRFGSEFVLSLRTNGLRDVDGAGKVVKTRK